MKKHSCFSSVFIIFLLFFCHVQHGLATTTDSAAIVSPSTIPMTNASMVATINVTLESTIQTGVGGIPFTYVAQCPTGSTYLSPTSPFTGNQVYACTTNPSFCNSSLQYRNTGPGGLQFITTTIQCGLSLQGFFPASVITPIYSPNTSAAPYINFNFGTINVNSVCWSNGCTCAPNSNIPSYGELCNNGNPYTSVTTVGSVSW